VTKIALPLISLYPFSQSCLIQSISLSWQDVVSCVLLSVFLVLFESLTESVTVSFTIKTTTNKLHNRSMEASQLKCVRLQKSLPQRLSVNTFALKCLQAAKRSQDETFQHLPASVYSCIVVRSFNWLMYPF